MAGKIWIVQGMINLADSVCKAGALAATQALGFPSFPFVPTPLPQQDLTLLLANLHFEQHHDAGYPFIPSQGFSFSFPVYFSFNTDQFNGWVQSRAPEWSALAGLWVEVVGDAGRRASRSSSAAGTPQSWHRGLGASPLAVLYKVAVSQLFLWCWLEPCWEGSPFLPPPPPTCLFLPTPPGPPVPSFVWLRREGDWGESFKLHHSEWLFPMWCASTVPPGHGMVSPCLSSLLV